MSRVRVVPGAAPGLALRTDPRRSTLTDMRSTPTGLRSTLTGLRSTATGLRSTVTDPESWNHYHFVSTWRLGASPAEVFAVLRDMESYPLWWPEVRSVRRLDEARAELVVRSLLPYDLVFVAAEARRDEAAGVLEATMSGDLEGFSRWTVSPAGDGTRAVFEERVEARKELLRRLAAVARPAFRANHALMMWHGRRGVGVYLAGFQAGARAR